MEFNTESEILQRMLLKGQETGLIGYDVSINDILNGTITENQYILTLSTIAYMLGFVTSTTKEVYESFNLDVAAGKSLDNLGFFLNVPRIEAQPAIVYITIGTPVSLNNDIQIPKGTRVLLESLFNGYNLEYVTSSDVILKSDTSEVSVRAETLDSMFQISIPSGAVVGLDGFPSLTATNNEASSNGKNIEEDDVYRERIKEWFKKNIRGTRECYEAYLLNYTGLNDFQLVPCYDGVGTLKIISDISSSELPALQEGVISNCSILTDEKIICVTPQSMGLGTQVIPLELTIIIDTKFVTDYSLFSQLIYNQTFIYFGGGVSNTGETVSGLKIGDNFYPSQLFNFLQKQFNKEILHISYNDEDAPVYVNTNNYKLTFDGYNSLVLKDIEDNILYPVN